MQAIAFDHDYLAELEFVAPVTHKLVYLFILTFRGVKKDEIARSLGLRAEIVEAALCSLSHKNLIVVDRRGCCHLPYRREALPPDKVFETADHRERPAYMYTGEQL